MTMTERAILFSGPMVRAILAGTKTQTRRLLRPQPPEALADTVHYDRATGGAMWASFHGDHGVSCPYGQPGDRLWVRETWWCAAPHESDGYPVRYRASAGVVMDVSAPWRPSIFMPRWASRLTLEVTGVRVELLQEISVDDCWAEGLQLDVAVPAKTQYARLWDSINAKRAPWASNPWVWVISFKPAARGAA